MNDKRQKNQLQMALAFTGEGRSEAPRAPREGTESFTAKCETESPARAEQLMEEVCGRENCQQALRRVKANKGSAGIDGMRVSELPGYLKQHWPALREQLLSGTYQPQPVRRVEIAKPDGGARKLGIPTVLDRFIQQAVMQVLQRRWDPTFSEHSHGFRPQRSAHQAVFLYIVLIVVLASAILVIRRLDVKTHPIARTILIVVSTLLFCVVAVYSTRIVGLMRVGMRKTYFSCPPRCPCPS